MAKTYTIIIITLSMTFLCRTMFINPQLSFLEKVLKKIQQDDEFNTLFILHHNESRNCSLHGFHYEIPTLRLTQLNPRPIKKYYNHRSLSLVCICKDTDIMLLDTLAHYMDGMRQEKIIIWIQIRVTEEVLRDISNQVEKYSFLEVSILDVMDDPKPEVSALRLNSFPSQHFQQIENIFDRKQSIFQDRRGNFKGRTASLKPAWSHYKWFGMLPTKDRIPINRVEDFIILDFALRYNLSLKVLKQRSSEMADFQLNSLWERKVFIKYINPYDVSSLMVIVPCGTEMRIDEVFQHLDVRSWLVHILLVYGIFVLAETFILMVTHRITGRAYRLTSLNPLLNLRAFRALLGMSFPISRRSSLSLRQLFLAISVFGFVFSNFFSCKLSALLTKHSQHSQIDDMDDLRSSGLTTIMDPHMRSLIVNRLGSDYITNNLSNVKVVTLKEIFDHLFSLDNSKAYVVLRENWHTLYNYQKLYRNKAFCTSRKLMVIRSIPRTYIQEKNSIYYWPLFLFSMRLQEAGITSQWRNKVPYQIKASRGLEDKDYAKDQIEPISVHHLMWLWSVLVCGYGLAVVVFIIEICLGGQRGRNWSLRSRNNNIVV